MTTNNAPTSGTGLAPNIASMVCYICAPLTSIIMMFVEKDNKQVLFHAWQATIFAVGTFVVQIALNILIAIVSQIVAPIGMVLGLFPMVIALAAFVVWIICLVKSFQGEQWKIPYIGDIAEKQVHKAV